MASTSSWNWPSPARAVPETYGLMALGLGVIGVMARRRRSAA
jgi:hypothetical protein